MKRIAPSPFAAPDLAARAHRRPPHRPESIAADRWLRAVVGVAAAVAFAWLPGCSGATVRVDAGTDGGNPNACVCSSGLSGACAANRSCPPDLGTPAFDTWAEAKLDAGAEYRAPSCEQAPDCPELLTVVFPQGVDCAEQYLFDATTKAFVAFGHTCNVFVGEGCKAASQCIPERCYRRGGQTSPVANCLGYPDGG